MNDPARIEVFPVPPVLKSIDVRCSPDLAFERFTREVHAWWPAKSHSLGGERVTYVGFEPRIGGRVFERLDDGSESTWGIVTAWEPPGRVVFTWHVGREPDTAQAVEVKFELHDGGTRVQLLHWGWERLGTAGLAARDQYDTGWNLVFGQRYAAHAVAGVSHAATS
ncbi:MAG TPA: SRPBCC domain-containing protein [Burkholderiaceae bacterium]|jgi:uncharacterized protein YndB with AHSA1/START domain|nr:SRPBCC domain-containing protein [Burkholderiaceae bacterium]